MLLNEEQKRGDIAPFLFIKEKALTFVSACE
jgi:hypothetical protein